MKYLRMTDLSSKLRLDTPPVLERFRARAH